MKKTKIVLRILSIVMMAGSITGLSMYAANKDVLTVVDYAYTSDKYTGSPYKIVHLSDIHNHSLDYENTNLIEAIDAENPDIIVISGDMVDDHTKDYTNVTELAAHFKSKNYPFYYVDGNHERHAPDEIREKEYSIFNENGGVYLYENSVDLGNNLVISGIRDPAGKGRDPLLLGTYYGDVPDQLDCMSSSLDTSKLNLMVCHRPEYFDIIKDEGYDVTFSGHTHGGQVNVAGWRVACYPWTKYISGSYSDGDKSLYVSNGLGYSYSLPLRYNCPATLLSVTIKSKA